MYFESPLERTLTFCVTELRYRLKITADEQGVSWESSWKCPWPLCVVAQDYDTEVTADEYVFWESSWKCPWPLCHIWRLRHRSESRCILRVLSKVPLTSLCCSSRLRHRSESWWICSFKSPLAKKHVIVSQKAVHSLGKVYSS